MTLGKAISILVLLTLLVGCGRTAGGPSTLSSPSGAACYVNGQARSAGSSWTCGCNTCYCDNGNITSTLLGCAP